MKRIKVKRITGEEKLVEESVAQNLINMFPKDWTIIEEEIEKPKKKRKPNKDLEIGEE
jgi:hypothetical protein